jgi:hypothetical protein
VNENTIRLIGTTGVVTIPVSLFLSAVGESTKLYDETPFTLARSTIATRTFDCRIVTRIKNRSLRDKN